MQISVCKRLAVAGVLALVVLAARGQGVTVAIGGALLDSNAAVWGRLVELAGGPGACFSVFATASSEPDDSAAAIGANLARHGARGEHIRVAPRIAGLDVAQAVRDPAWVAKVMGCRGVFFTGGAQERLLDSLQPGSRSTPLLDAIRAVWRRGGVVAGTSSGAAVLSAVAFRDAPDPLAVMQGTLRRGQEWDGGFGFVPAGVIVDQHFIRRGRIARLLPLMQAQGVPLGVGVEEDSAAVFIDDGIEVIGARGVLVADLTASMRDAVVPAFNVQGATLHWLQSGDRFDLPTRRVRPSAARQAGNLPPGPAAALRDDLAGEPFEADILASGVIVQAMARLVTGEQRQLRGLAFGAGLANGDPRADIGFEWRLWRDAATTGWLDPGAQTPTLSGVRLDIVPVRRPGRADARGQRPPHETIHAPRTTPP